MRTLPAFLLLLSWSVNAIHSAEDGPHGRPDAASAAAAIRTPLLRPAAAPRILAAPPIGLISLASVQRIGSGSVPRFGSIRLKVTFAGLTGTHYYDARSAQGGVDLQATFTGPDGGIWHIPGFFDGADWFVRFSPDTVGAWTYTVQARDSSGTATASGGTFTCAGSAGHGWIRIDGRWLRHTDGTPFCPVSHNTGWQDDVAQPAFTQLIADAPSGSAPRLLSFWLGVPWSHAPIGRKTIENITLGEWGYNQDTCAYIDQVVSDAESNGVFLMPSIWIHPQLRHNNVPAWGIDENHWSNQPYSAMPAPTPAITAADFFLFTNGVSDTEQWARQQNLMRYIIARWGYSQSIAGWVGVVELNGTTGYAESNAKKNQALAWCGAVDDWFVANDRYRSSLGRAPVAFSLTDEDLVGSGAYVLDPGGVLSMRAVDSYDKKSDDIGIAQLLADECATMGAAGKPVLITEFGGFINTGASQPAHMHNGTWASLVAGAAMPAMQWCDLDNTGPLNLTMRQHLGYLAAFIGQDTSWMADSTQSIATLAVTGRAASPTDVRGWSRRVTDRGMAWMQRHLGATALDGASTLVSSASGSYHVWWYDTWTGLPIAESDETVASGGSLALIVPTATIDTRPDIAVSWQRYPTAPSNVSITVPAGERALFTFASSAPVSRITTLPAHGRLWQTADGVTAGTEITTVPTVITDPSRRVIYQASAYLGLETFTFAVTDARLSRSATASITVSNPPPGSSIIPIENVPGGGGCGAGGFAGLGLLALLGLVGLRRSRRPER